MTSSRAPSSSYPQTRPSSLSFSRRAILETRRCGPLFTNDPAGGYGTSIRAAAGFAWGSGLRRGTRDARGSRKGGYSGSKTTVTPSMPRRRCWSPRARRVRDLPDYPGRDWPPRSSSGRLSSFASSAGIRARPGPTGRAAARAADMSVTSVVPRAATLTLFTRRETSAGGLGEEDVRPATVRSRLTRALGRTSSSTRSPLACRGPPRSGGACRA